MSMHYSDPEHASDTYYLLPGGLNMRILFPNGDPARITDAQRDSIHKLLTRDLADPNDAPVTVTVTPELFGNGTVLLSWAGMLVGVEPDGYTHT